MSSSSYNIGKTAVTSGALFGLAMGVMNGVRSGAGAGIASGLAMGVVFGLAIAGFLHWQSKKAGKLRVEFEREGVVRDAPANIGAAGGWLFLTKERVVWIPHALNVGAKRVEIPLAEITAAKPSGRKLEIVTSARSWTILVRASDDWATAIAPLPTARLV